MDIWELAFLVLKGVSKGLNKHLIVDYFFAFVSLPCSSAIAGVVSDFRENRSPGIDEQRNKDNTHEHVVGINAPRRLNTCSVHSTTKAPSTNNERNSLSRILIGTLYIVPFLIFFGYLLFIKKKEVTKAEHSYTSINPIYAIFSHNQQIE